MKKGITLINLTIVILLLALISGMVVYEGSDAIATTNKTKFAIEILDVQTKVDNYYIENGKYPSVAQVVFDISKFKEEEKTQIVGETVSGNNITL
jgi:Tfp pilus assembly protein PilE